MIWIERRHIFLAALFVGHLLLIGGIVMLITNRMEKRFLQALKSTQNSVEQLKENELLIAQDLNHARAVLGLNVRTYDFQNKEDEQSPKEKTAYTPLFQAVETILSLKEQQEWEASLIRTLRSPEIVTLLGKHGLELKKEKGRVELQKKGVPYVTFSLSKEKPLTIESYLGNRLKVDSPDLFTSRLSVFLQEQIPILDSHFSRMQQLRTQLLATCAKQQVQTLASQKGLFLSKEEESVTEVRLRYLLKAEPTLTKIQMGLDYRGGTFFLEKQTFQKIEIFEEALIQSLKNADTRTSKQIHLDSILNSLRTQIKDAGFQSYLQSKKMKVSDKIRENDEYTFIDLLEEKGTRIGSIGILKIKGDIFLFDKDDVPITSLRMFTFPSPMQEKKKSLNPGFP